MDQRKVILFISSFVFGVFLSSFLSIPPLLSVLLLLIAGAILLSEKIWNKNVSKEIFLIFLFIISFSLGTLRYAVKDFHIGTPPSEEFRGIVVSEPEPRDNTTRFVVKTETEKVLVYDKLYSQVKYGDEVVVRGELEKPEIIEDETGRPFNYPEYLAKDDIYYTASFVETEIVSSGHGNPIKKFLLDTKQSFVLKTKVILAEPHASLLSGLIVAGKQAMPKDILEEFRRAGVVHIVVLSGFNITIIADFLRRVFQYLFMRAKFLPIEMGPKLAAGASILGIIFFVLMTGAEATVVRAAIMVLAVIAAKMFGRDYSAPRALVAAAFIMILVNPKILVFDPSFQLSFLATTGLIYVAPIVEKYLKWVTEKGGVRGMLATTVATQVTVLPFLVYSMGEVSLVSLPANILILLTIPAAMLIGFIATMLAYISPLLAIPFAYVTHLILSWILGVSHVLGNLTLASVHVSFLSIWIVVVIYLVLIAYIKYFAKEKTRATT
ncbi:MAG: ComEC/Rec2 family competence protein [bacterium]|nr:ComEC/Rec2 family competence protein [bacterium]